MTTLEKAQIEKARSLIRFCHEQQYGCKKCIFADYNYDKGYLRDCGIEFPQSWELPEE